MKLSKFLTSLSAIMIPMIIVLVAFIIDAGILFFRAFPDMPYLLKVIAAANLGVGLAFPLLLTAINSPILPNAKLLGFKVGFPELFALCTAFMIAFFFDIVPGGMVAVQIFLSVMLGLIDYLYAYLFITKYKEVHTEATYQERFNDLDAEFKKLEQEHSETSKALNEARTKLTEAIKELTEYRQQLTCPHCNELLKRFGSYRNHVNRCSSNPKNYELHG